MRKIWLLALALIIAVSLAAGPVLAQQEQSSVVAQQPLTDRQVRINASVAAICNKYQQQIGKMRQAAYVGNATLDTSDVEPYVQQKAIDCMAEIRAYLESEGLVECGRYDGESFVIGEESISPDVTPNALASELAVYQQAVKDADGSIYYYAYWDWTPVSGIYDPFWDTYDLVSAQLESDNGWRWRSMECQTWDQNGSETGFTDGNSWNTRGDGVTLRDDFWMGKIFNVYDFWQPLNYTYKTDTVRIAGWITPGSTSTNRVKSNFEHNWKTSSLQTSAGITGANIVSFSLSVTYSNAHQSWLRGSNASTVTK